MLMKVMTFFFAHKNFLLSSCLLTNGEFASESIVLFLLKVFNLIMWVRLVVNIQVGHACC